MAYRRPGDGGKAAVEVCPIASKNAATAGCAAGLAAADIPALMIVDDNTPGMAYCVSRAIAAADINLAFFMAQTIGRKFSAVVGFETVDDAEKALPAIQSIGREAKS
jgi:hypothetical protein